MSVIAQLSIAHGVLLVALGALLVKALKTVQRLDYLVPPIGARRVHFGFTFGSPFPAHHLPPDLAARVATGTALFVHAGPTCCVCKPVIRSLPYLAADYPEVPVVLFSDPLWDPYGDKHGSRVIPVEGGELTRCLKVSMEPYAIKTVDGVIVDFGIVNSGEHVESLLASRGEAARGLPA